MQTGSGESDMKSRRVKKSKTQKGTLFGIAQDFCIGFGSCFAIQGQVYQETVNSILSTTDSNAIRSDWCSVGNDLKTALDFGNN